MKRRSVSVEYVSGDSKGTNQLNNQSQQNLTRWSHWIAIYTWNEQEHTQCTHTHILECTQIKTKKSVKKKTTSTNEETCSHREPRDQVMIVWWNDEMVKEISWQMRSGNWFLVFLSFVLPYSVYCIVCYFVSFSRIAAWVYVCWLARAYICDQGAKPSRNSYG